MGYRRFKIPQPSEDGASPLIAAALQFDREKDRAPKVVASGQRKIAEQILAEAHKYDIPIHDDPVLTAALASVNLGQEIPPELYNIVAEILAYIYRVTDKYSK